MNPTHKLGLLGFPPIWPMGEEDLGLDWSLPDMLSGIFPQARGCKCSTTWVGKSMDNRIVVILTFHGKSYVSYCRSDIGWQINLLYFLWI